MTHLPSLSIVFGYTQRYLCPRLCPGACIYRSHDEGVHSFYHGNLEDMDTFIETRNPSIIRYICYNVRVPEMDAENHIVNRYAYTTISLEFKKISTINPVELWRTLRENQKAIQYMKECGQISNETIEHIEKKLWDYLDPYSKKRILKTIHTIIKHICINHAEKYWHPEYVWKTGPNAGKKTSQILIERAGLN